MPSVNKAFVIGHVGRDAEVRQTANNNAVCNFSIATNRRWVNKATGERNEETDWHNCVMFGNRAEKLGAMIKKGALVFVEGHQQTQKWEAQDGTQRTKTEIVVSNFEFLSQRQGGGQASESRNRAAPAEGADLNDDIPF